jgi:hypothetical protein
MQPLNSVLLAAATLLTACGLITERSLYKGIRANQKNKTEGPVSKQLPDYDAYKKEREQIKR